MNDDKYYVEKAGYKYNPNVFSSHLYTDNISILEYGKKQIPRNDNINTWVGITKFDIEQLLKFIRDYSKYAKLIKSNLPLNLPEIDIISFIKNKKSNFNIIFGNKGNNNAIENYKNYI